MKHDRISQIDIWNGILKCMNDRPMTLPEMAEVIFGKHDAASVGRVALRIEGMVEARMAKVLVVKNKLMFALNMSINEGR